jgi:hypothetical protein
MLMVVFCILMMARRSFLLGSVTGAFMPFVAFATTTMAFFSFFGFAEFFLIARSYDDVRFEPFRNEI